VIGWISVNGLLALSLGMGIGAKNVIVSGFEVDMQVSQTEI
jgi:hypothetical protein